MSDRKATPENLMDQLLAGKGATSPLVNKSTSKQLTVKTRYKRMTFHLLPEQIKSIKSIAFHSDKDISEVAREALQAYIEKQINK